MNSQNSLDIVMTLGEVAEYLKIGEKTVHRMIGRNEIPCAKVGGQWRFFRPMIDDWLVSKMRGSPPASRGSVDGAIDLEGWLASEIFVQPTVRRGDTREILASLIEPMEEILPNSRNFLSLLVEREGMLSTAVGNGVAFPHLRHPQANPRGGPYLTIGICPEGAMFDSPDGNPVYLFALYCAHDETAHLRGLSKLSMIFSRPDTVRDLLASRTREEVISIITKETHE